ncbi:hypothetical protein FD754_018217, partial [Muntiacus muntjak]
IRFSPGVSDGKESAHNAGDSGSVPGLGRGRGGVRRPCMKAMQSLKSRGYVKEQFAWRHFYWYLTNEGIQDLRDYLHLPPEIVPATLRRSRPETGRPRPKGLEGERPARLTRGEADRDKAEAGAGSATEFQFRGGSGRGRGQPPQ